MVEVYRASGEIQARVIQGLLQSYQISSVLESNAAGSVHPFTFDGMGEVRVMVWESRFEEAKRLIQGSGNG